MKSWGIIGKEILMFIQSIVLGIAILIGLCGFISYCVMIYPANQKNKAATIEKYRDTTFTNVITITDRTVGNVDSIRIEDTNNLILNATIDNVRLKFRVHKNLFLLDDNIFVLDPRYKIVQ